MSEIAKLCKKAYDKLTSSKTLYEIGNYGDSVSLAYYSMFLMAKSLLRKKGFDAKTHQGLMNLFSLKFVYEEDFDHEIYANFAASQSIREDADYSADDCINQEIAEEVTSHAEEFLSEAEKFL